MFFDLANFSNNHELSEDEDHFLLTVISDALARSHSPT